MLKAFITWFQNLVLLGKSERLILEMGILLGQAFLPRKEFSIHTVRGAALSSLQLINSNMSVK